MKIPENKIENNKHLVFLNLSKSYLNIVDNKKNIKIFKKELNNK